MSELFKEIVKTTAEIASVDATSIKLSTDKCRRWDDIADFWKKNDKIFSKIFLKAVFYTKTGMYWQNSKNELKPLIEFIGEAFESDDDAVCVWKERLDYSLAEQKIYFHFMYTDDDTCSTIFDYMEDSYRFNTIWRESVMQRTFPPKPKKKEREHLALIEQKRMLCDCFEEAILFLLPSASRWSRRQWTSQKHIFKKLNAKYGVDYSANTRDFEFLIKMLIKKSCSISYHRELFSIKTLSDSMANTIWPTGIESEFCEMFMNISNEPPVFNNGNNLHPDDPTKESWAYNKIFEWNNNDPVVTEAVRSNLMLFEMGVHPYRP